MVRYVLEHHRNSLENVVFELEFPMARSISLSEFSEPLKKIRNNVNQICISNIKKNITNPMFFTYHLCGWFPSTN